MTELKPCPFCENNYRFDLRGEYLYLACNGCQIYFSVKISELMTYEEIEESKYFMDKKFIERAKNHLIELWNTRAPSKDRELLVELSKPNISFDDLCNESYVSNTVTDGKTTLLLGNSIEFTERDTKEGAEARIALRIRKHLEGNP